LQGSRPPAELERLKAEDVFEAARRGQAWAEKIIAETVDYLAIALVNLTAVLDPGLIVLGGGVSRSADLLIGPIMARMRGLIPNPPRIVVSALGMRATVLGAAIRVFDNASNSVVVQKRS
jgi:predicted NBD/HSP70 family sugar kinase